MPRISHATRASQGTRRYQEDTATVWPDSTVLASAPGHSSEDAVTLVAALADGMGGHTGGALASRTICAAFIESIAEGEGAIAARLQAALLVANGEIGRKVDENPVLAGMGATLVGVVFRDQGAEWVSVGDSPLYLIRRGEIARLNDDHSLAPMLDKLVAEGSLSPEMAKIDPRRHYLRSAVSGEELDLIDVSQRPLVLQGGDVILLASDGIHALGDEAIARLVTKHSRDGADAVARALIDAVDGVGDPMQDNTTVVVVAIEDEISPS